MWFGWNVLQYWRRKLNAEICINFAWNQVDLLVHHFLDSIHPIASDKHGCVNSCIMYVNLRWTFHHQSFDYKRSIFIVLQNDLINYFTICFKHWCKLWCNTMHTFYKAVLCMVILEIGAILWRNFISTIFATLLRNHRNYSDTLMPVDPSASLLWKNIINCCQ